MTSSVGAGVRLVLNKQQTAAVGCVSALSCKVGVCVYVSLTPSSMGDLRSRMQQGYYYYRSLYCTEVCKLQIRAAKCWLVVPNMHCSWCGDFLCCSSLVVLAPPPDAGFGRVQYCSSVLAQLMRTLWLAFHGDQSSSLSFLRLCSIHLYRQGVHCCVGFCSAEQDRIHSSNRVAVG